MKIYTRTGDDGSTSLAGGERVSKSSERLEAYGTVDELIAWIGTIRFLPENNTRSQELGIIQDKLMHCAAILAAGKGARVERMSPPKEPDIKFLEDWIDEMNKGIEPLNSFILPGGSQAIGQVHISRTVCRRAERAILRISDDYSVDKDVVKYINRLSDYLFTLARRIEFETGKKQAKWNT